MFLRGTRPSISFLGLARWWAVQTFGEFASVPVLLAAAALCVNLVASLILSHRDVDGSPSFCVVGNALVQALAVVPCAVMGFSTGGGMLWLMGPVDPSPDSWGHLTLWWILAVCVKGRLLTHSIDHL